MLVYIENIFRFKCFESVEVLQYSNQVHLLTNILTLLITKLLLITSKIDD